MDKALVPPDGYYRCTRSEMLPFIPEGVQKILDIGCSEGEFGALLKQERGAEVWGVELNAQVAEKASAKLDKVIVGSIEGLPAGLPVDYFDCIVFNDVLEHLRDPWQVVGNMKGYLKDGGAIVASIPNIRYYAVLKNLVIKKRFEYESYGVMDKTHLRFFTIKTIPELFTGNGFTVEILQGLKWEKLPFKYSILNKLLFSALEDTRYMQFVCVARKVA